MPGLKKSIAPLEGYALEIKNGTWGKDTDLIRREMADAMSSLNLVVAAMEEASVEYEKGPFGGKLKPDKLAQENGLIGNEKFESLKGSSKKGKYNVEDVKNFLKTIKS